VRVKSGETPTLREPPEISEEEATLVATGNEGVKRRRCGIAYELSHNGQPNGGFEGTNVLAAANSCYTHPPLLTTNENLVCQ
jgi:hypothetical protein